MPPHPPSENDRPVVIWFRRDLRLEDNAALTYAAESGRPVAPLFILDEDAGWAPGGAARWWLHQSLAAFGADLTALGAPLTLRRGDAREQVAQFVEEVDAGAIVWNRQYEPAAVARDKALKAMFRADGRMVESFPGDALVEPWAVKTGADRPYQVYSPFARAARPTLEPLRPPSPAPDDLRPLDAQPASDVLSEWALQPTEPNWAGGLAATWAPGEAGALERLDRFIERALARYKGERDFPGVESTSRLSPHLAWGEISPRAIWHATEAAGGGDKFLSEILWREFSRNLLFHFPDLPEAPLRKEFAGFPWRDDEDGFRAWSKGLTGYPIVDAGMRELWATGWMHNRVRMIVASFLVKNLLIHWTRGQDWFWDTLVDADLANNSASWQWVAGCGADAAPYFRIFNPILQGKKFDPDGAYVRRWVPELSMLPDRVLHAPWEAPELVLKEAGVALGENYPKPIIDHGFARDRALAAYETIKKAA